MNEGHRQQPGGRHAPSVDAPPRAPPRIGSVLRGVRARLVLLALACVIPMLLLAAGSTLRYVHAEQKAIREHGIELARLAAEYVDQEVAVARSLLIGLSTAQAMQAGDMEAMYQQAIDAAQRHGKPIGFNDPAGNRRFNTMRPFGTPLALHPAANLIRVALETRQTQISNLLPAPTRGDQAVLLLEPALVHGSVAGVFGIELDVARMVQRIAETKLPEHWLVAILDRKGIIIGRSRFADRYVGTPATPDLLALIAAAPSGVSSTRTKEGFPVFTAYTKAQTSGWTVVVGVPDSIVQMPLEASLKELAITATGVTALTIGLALFAARGISRPMLGLADAARSLGRGEPIPPILRGLPQVERVWASLHRASDDLAARARERESAERRAQDLQLELMRASRLSAMGAVGSSIAHELNQPLAAIVNHLEAGRLLGRDSGADPDLMDALAQALAQAERAGRIIQNIRSFATRRGVQYLPEAVAPIIEEACALGLVGTAKAGIRVTRSVDPDCPAILADHVQVQQVLVNLIRNAVEAMAGAPRRDLAVGAVYRPSSDMVEFSVADSGEGVSGEVAGALFTLFLTTKPGGMGVGLSIARSIVEAHGGRIWTEPNPGGGTLFRFTIPTAPEVATHGA